MAQRIKRVEFQMVDTASETLMNVFMMFTMKGLLRPADCMPVGVLLCRNGLFATTNR